MWKRLSWSSWGVSRSKELMDPEWIRKMAADWEENGKFSIWLDSVVSIRNRNPSEWRCFFFYDFQLPCIWFYLFRNAPITLLWSEVIHDSRITRLSWRIFVQGQWDCKNPNNLWIYFRFIYSWPAGDKVRNVARLGRHDSFTLHVIRNVHELSLIAVLCVDHDPHVGQTTSTQYKSGSS